MIEPLNSKLFHDVNTVTLTGVVIKEEEQALTISTDNAENKAVLKKKADNSLLGCVVYIEGTLERNWLVVHTIRAYDPNGEEIDVSDITDE